MQDPLPPITYLARKELRIHFDGLRQKHTFRINLLPWKFPDR